MDSLLLELAPFIKVFAYLFLTCLGIFVLLLALAMLEYLGSGASVFWMDLKEEIVKIVKLIRKKE